MVRMKVNSGEDERRSKLENSAKMDRHGEEGRLWKLNEGSARRKRQRAFGRIVPIPAKRWILFVNISAECGVVVPQHA